MTNQIQNASKIIMRPPIVAVLGHVDHGKTSLLDAIRNTNQTAKEAGGITQHIGAYQVDTDISKTSAKTAVKKKLANQELNRITFIDTPGHEAFAKMRSRGAQVADIAVLVVAADDGVMPQTLESIKTIKQAKIPYMVALNKTDLPNADVKKVKQQLARNEVLIEGYGGDVVLVPISAKTGKGIPEFLEIILLLSAMNEISGSLQDVLEATVIEAKKDIHRGNLATLLIRNGILSIGQIIYAENTQAKVRAMYDDKGKQVQKTNLSQPIVVMGWDKLPDVGVRITPTPVSTLSQSSVKVFYSYSLPPLVTEKKLRLVLKTDTAGSLEAVSESLSTLVEIVSKSIGEITESDILLAKSTGSIIIGFNTRPTPGAFKLSDTEKVRIKTYAIIYELLDEIAEVTQLLNKPETQEQVLGKAQVLAIFNIEDTKIAGCRVLDGKVARGDHIKIIRQDIEIGRSRIKSLRHGKNDIAKAETGSECGLIFDKKLDFQVGDTIIAYKIRDLLS